MSKNIIATVFLFLSNFFWFGFWCYLIIAENASPWWIFVPIIFHWGSVDFTINKDNENDK